jgi:hypothetical protein
MQLFERNTPSVAGRLGAMRQCAQVGYPVRAVVMPIIPLAEWQEIYGHFMEQLMESVPLSRITLGSICSYAMCSVAFKSKSYPAARHAP